MMMALNTSSLEQILALAYRSLIANRPYKKNSSLGWPSSANRNAGLEIDLYSCKRRAELVIDRFWNDGPAFDRVIMRAG